MAVELDLGFFLQARVVLPEDLQNLGAAELLRDGISIGEHLAQESPAQDEMVFPAVGTGLEGCHFLALTAIERPVYGEHLDGQGVLGNLIEYLLRVKGAIVIPNTCMIASDDHVACSIVLPENRVKQGFPRAGIPHLHGVDLGHDPLRGKIMIDHCLHAANANIGRDVPLLQFSHQLVDKEAIRNLEGNPGQVFMGSMHGIAQLEGRDGVPAPFLEYDPSLLGPCVEVRKSTWIVELALPGAFGHRF